MGLISHPTRGPLFHRWQNIWSVDEAEYAAKATQEDHKKDQADVLYNIKADILRILSSAIEFKKFVDENVDQIKSHAGRRRKSI